MSHLERKPVIGLVGGVGSGKSTVAAALVRRGGHLVVGDALGHEGLRQPDLRNRTVARWGERILDAKGEVDRRTLGRIVFADPAERKALEAILFPYIERRIREELQAAQENPATRFAVLDAAVMLEAGWAKECDHIVFIDVSRAERLRRIQRHRGWNESELEHRESAQMSLEEKRTFADAVVDNNGDAEAIDPQIDTLLARWGIKS